MKELFCTASGTRACVFIWRAIWQDFVKLRTLIPSRTAFLPLNLYPRRVLSQMPRGPHTRGPNTVLGFPGMRDHEEV